MYYLLCEGYAILLRTENKEFLKLDWYISNNNFVSHINHIIWIKEPLPLLISKTFDYDYELHESPNTKIPKLQSQDVYKDDSMYDNDYNNIIIMIMCR